MNRTGKIVVHVVGNGKGWKDGQELYRTNDEWDAILFARKFLADNEQELHEVWGSLNIIHTETGKLSENW